MPFNTGQIDLLQLDRDDFDFNIQFEQLFFSIIPSALFIATSLWRTIGQARKPTIVNARTFRFIKLSAITAYAGLELILLILAAIGSLHVSSMFLAASVLQLISALSMISLSLLDHSKSPRPSVLLTSYLSLTLVLDIAQTRTLFLSSDDKPQFTYSAIFSTALALKVGILLLEARKKSRWLAWDEKEHSPEETSGIFSLGVFAWLNELFLTGYKKVLTMEDLYPLDEALHSQSLHDKFSAKMNYSRLKGDKFGLVKVLIRTLKGSLFVPIIPRLALLAFTFCQPLFIEKLLNNLSKAQIDVKFGYGFIGASILIYSGIAISTALYWYWHHRMRTMIRSILVAEIFSKATQARLNSSDDSAAVTLMSTDIERIDVGLRSLHEVWASVIQAGLASWLLYGQLGVLFVAPIGVAITCFLGLVILMRFTGDSQKAWMNQVQRRVSLTANVIGSMKNVKLSGISSPVSAFVQQLRINELAAGARFRKIIIIAALFGFIPFLIGPPLTFAFTQNTLDSSTMFTSLSYLTLLTNPLTQIFQAIPQVISALACLGRIQAFLECDTRDDFRKVLHDTSRNLEKTLTDSEASSAAPADPSSAVVIEDANFGWEADKFTLQNVSTHIPKSLLTIVVGSVGSGKSTFCKALLGEIPFHAGCVKMSMQHPHVGVCEQTAFLSNGSIKDNIVGFSSFDIKRYTEVIQATALDFDLDTLTRGDETNIGSDGITLSGGQKQRVSLARALYLQSDLLILDDVLSGLDADTEEKVFRQVFGPTGLLRRRKTTTVLCTHSIRHLSAADHIIALGEGTIIEQGSFNKLITNQGYVQSLRLWDSSGSGESSESLSIGEDKKRSKAGTSPASPPLIDPINDTTRQNGDRTVYKHYLKSMGWFQAVSGLIFAALWGFFTNFPTVWLTYWSGDVYRAHPAHSWAYYAGLYALFQICALMSLLLLAIDIFLVSIKRAGANLHQEALQTLIRAPLRFFTATDTGIVTNLFSQDLNLVDTELPNALLNTLVCVFSAMGQAGVMPTSSPYMAISYPFLAALLYFVQKFYLRTARQLRLLDLEAKSPLYTHFLDTTKGVTTLRAFGFISEELEKNARLLDASQRPAYLLVMIQQWLNLVLDVVIMIMAAVLTTLAVRLHSSAGFTGASLVTLMNFGENLSGIVIFYTKLETSIGAISRLKTFNETVLPEDREEEDIIPPEQWPQKGVITMNGVSASYGTENSSDDLPSLALRNISLTVSAGEKIAICGRTGSGKSSFVALILKLLDPTPDTAANVSIDDTPLVHIDRSTLRQRILAVPQEAVFLPDGSSFKTNLDPSGVATAEECQSVLEIVGLWLFIRERGGLDASMSAGTLSAGQRQLMSLGRALLRRRIRSRRLESSDRDSEGGILLLDEVSSSVDQDTEGLMQEIIRTEFRSYTVVAVSHRLDMIMDFDRVVVMDMGEIVETGNPKALIARENSKFGELVKASGR